jgi:hypothetical protein
LESCKVLFHKNGNPIGVPRIRRLLSEFGESYDKVVKKIITDSTIVNRDTFRSNVATLMPPFLMTRRGAFHGLKIVGGIIRDPNRALDICWTQVDGELQDLKKYIGENTSGRRSRATLELSPESRKHVTGKISELFRKLKWTTVNGSDVGRVGASKILFAVFPEIALPVDNDEWDHVFRTDDYGSVLSTMIDEINEWEAKSQTPFESLNSPPTTIPSIYNVMAMDARPVRRTTKSALGKIEI